MATRKREKKSSQVNILETDEESCSFINTVVNPRSVFKINRQRSKEVELLNQPPVELGKKRRRCTERVSYHYGPRSVRARKIVSPSPAIVVVKKEELTPKILEKIRTPTTDEFENFNFDAFEVAFE